MNLSTIRKEKNLTIIDLSNLTGISSRTIEDIERRKDCKVSTAIVLAQSLSISLDELCIPKGGNMLMYKYRLTDATNRKNTDLTNYRTVIQNSITNIFPNVFVNVYSDYFEIGSSAALPSTGLRKMGQDIANNHTDFRQIVKTYNYTRSNGQKGQSNQLFKSFQ